ncbi:MAG TPA: hypothetical protein VFO40_14735 [Chthoniobacterales bacterium]|nr:hypothetical protein [Chthoniobacterales bacterium]
MKLLKYLTRNLIAIVTIATLLSIPTGSPAAELKPLVVIGIPLDRVAIRYPVPAYPRAAQVLKIAGDVQLRVQVKQGEIVSVTAKGAPLLADFSSHWVRTAWKFRPSVSGQFSVPISYQLHG